MNLSQRLALSKARSIDPTDPRNSARNSSVERAAQGAANAGFASEVARKERQMIGIINRVKSRSERVQLARQYGISTSRIR